MKWRASVDRSLAGIGLTHAQYSLLASLRGLTRSGHAPSQRELADVTGLDAVHVSKLVKALDRAGLVQRLAHPTDTRAVQLALTEDGVATVDRAIPIVHDLLDHLTAPLGGTRSKRTRSLMAEIGLLLDVEPT